MDSLKVKFVLSLFILAPIFTYGTSAGSHIVSENAKTTQSNFLTKVFPFLEKSTIRSSESIDTSLNKYLLKIIHQSFRKSDSSQLAADFNDEQEKNEDDETDKFIPFTVHRVEPSRGPHPNGMCVFPVRIRNNFKKIAPQFIRQPYEFKGGRVKFNYKLTIRGTEIKVRLRALGYRRVARVAIKLFIPPIRLKNKNQLGPIKWLDYRDTRNKGYVERFDIRRYRVPEGKANCCDVDAQVGFFIKTCNRSVKRPERCGFKLMSLPIILGCEDA